jgi:hypothetical protein
MRRDCRDKQRSAPPPILLFDERRLTPSFGYVFHPKWVDPGESIVSILWKFARMNALPGHVVAAQLATHPIDPYEGIAPRRECVDVRRLRQALGLPLYVLREALLPSQRYRAISPYLRFCRKCLRRGYHGILHQLELLQLCPMHGEWLQTDCRHCGQPIAFHLNAHLLDAPFRCAHCRAFYLSTLPSFLDRKPLPLPARVALTRTRLRFAV